VCVGGEEDFRVEMFERERKILGLRCLKRKGLDAGGFFVGEREKEVERSIKRTVIRI
jgi:hypothetical protein